MKRNHPHPALRLVVDNDRDSSGPGGYKSGRSRWRETPDTDSISSTRSAGIRLRHFWTAWYRTPHLRANGAKPPAASMANSMGGFESEVSMAEPKIQPLVAFRNQPIRVPDPITIQPMVGAAKHRAREEFSQWLNERCADLGAPRRGRPRWLEKRLREKAGLTVSYETCRKWLGGLDMPDRANERLLHEALGVSVQYESTDEDFQELKEIWASLPADRRRHVLETAKMAHAVTAAEQRHRHQKPARKVS